MRPPPQKEPRIILDEMDPMPPSAYQITRGNPTVPQTHRYNTRSRQLQGRDLMENHMATINNPTPSSRNKSPLVRPAGDDWAVIKQ